jgi:beta-lactamase superfamily II metal-dependent hydrolase
MRKKLLLCLTTLIFVVFLASCAASSSISRVNARSRLSIHFIDVGLGDSIFMELPSGENMLIDVGSPSAGPGVVHYLKSLGIRKIDRLILTHPDDDHIGGIFGLFPEFEILSIYDNGLSNFSSNIFRDYTALVRKDLSKYHILQAGESFLFSDITIDVLNPLFPPAGNPNSDSIVLRLVYKDISVLLTADMGLLGEKRLLNAGTDLRSTVLKVSHHGENDACSSDFLKNVSPAAAVISVSRINRYARPHSEVLKRIEETGARIYRTDHHGSIVFETDGTVYSILTEK